jgi:hypothetical protein
MVHGEEYIPLIQVSGQGRYVVTAPLQLDVIALFDAVSANMDLHAAGRDTDDLVAQEEIGAAAQGFGSVYGNTRHSGMCHVPLVKRVCRESYNDPEAVYAALKRRGMDLVTVTDHDWTCRSQRMPLCTVDAATVR